VQPKHAAERITKLTGTLSPEVKAELSMLLNMQLQEKVEAVLASWPVQPHHALFVPLAKPWESQQPPMFSIPIGLLPRNHHIC
jgi:hypothetical protein